MKKFLVITAVLLACAIAGVIVFAATFDLNRYRPLILKQIKSATGKEARIGRISLAWKDGLAARVDGLQLFDAGDTEPDASLDRLIVRLQLEPLLHKEVRVSGVSLSGAKLTVERFADGTVSVAGIRPPKQGAVAEASHASPAAAAGAAAFSIGSIRIENAALRFIDRSSAPPVDLSVSDLDADIKNVSLNGPVSFAARASVFGDKQNVAVGGRVTAPQGSEPALLDNFTLQLDLSGVDLKQLEHSIPAARQAGLRAPLGGMLQAKIDRLAMDPAEMARAKAAVSLKNGSLSLASVPLPLESVQLEASLQSGNAEVRSFSARFAEGTLQFRGTVKDISGAAVSAFSASARELSVGKLARIVNPRAPRLEGHLSLDFEGRGQGLGAEPLKQTLAGQGRLAMKDGVLVNANLLRTLVDKISRIPGVGRSAIERIPPQYLAKIDDPSTILRPFEMPFTVSQGRVFLERLNVPTDAFLLTGNGSIGFDRSLAIQGAVVFEQGFSRALLAAAPPTQYFADPNGSIVIQATIEGVPPNVLVKPNLDAALQRVGQQVVTDLLQKKDPKEILSGLLSGGQQPPQGAVQAQQQTSSGGIPLEPAAGEPQQAQTQTQSTEDALVGLLANALNKNKQQ